MAKLVSKTYGDALFALAVEEHMVDQLYEEAQAVAQILRENTELTRLMNHPKIEKEEKVRLIEDIFKGRIGDELVGLLRMLVQKGHYKETDQVFTYFIDRVKEYKKIGTAYVTSAMELTPQQKQAVEQKLLDTTKYVQFEIHYTTDTRTDRRHGHPDPGPCCGRQCPDQTGTSDKRLRTYTIESR